MKSYIYKVDMFLADILSSAYLVAVRYIYKNNQVHYFNRTAKDSCTWRKDMLRTWRKDMLHLEEGHAKDMEEGHAAPGGRTC